MPKLLALERSTIRVVEGGRSIDVTWYAGCGACGYVWGLWVKGMSRIVEGFVNV